MLKYLIPTCLLLLSGLSHGLEYKVGELDGEYSLAQKERSDLGMVNKKVVQLGEMNNQVILAIAACPKKCMPFVFYVDEKFTKQLKRPVYFNKSGMYAVGYDKTTFITLMTKPVGYLDSASKNGFSYINVYSKKGTSSISVSKAKAFILKQLDK